MLVQVLCRTFFLYDVYRERLKEVHIILQISFITIKSPIKPNSLKLKLIFSSPKLQVFTCSLILN